MGTPNALGSDHYEITDIVLELHEDRVTDEKFKVRLAEGTEEISYRKLRTNDGKVVLGFGDYVVGKMREALGQVAPTYKKTFHNGVSSIEEKVEVSHPGGKAAARLRVTPEIVEAMMPLLEKEGIKATIVNSSTSRSGLKIHEVDAA